VADTMHETVGVAEAHHEEATALGMDAGGWVALAMLVVIGIMLYAKVPALIAGMLDKKIAGIREQLDTATRLRKEAEALKAEYEAKAKSAESDIAAIHAGAERDAKAIIEQAKVDATALIERRGKMAEERIAAAERAAIAEVRAKAADTAVAAATALIMGKHDGGADKALVDGEISRLN
jgi:F-type H+-transporting ATPase subunit b